MSTDSFRGIVKSGSIILEDPISEIPDGTHVLIMPIGEPLVRGTPAGILAAMRAEPRVSKQDVEELMKIIAEARQPVMPKDIFEG